MTEAIFQRDFLVGIQISDLDSENQGIWRGHRGPGSVQSRNGTKTEYASFWRESTKITNSIETLRRGCILFSEHAGTIRQIGSGTMPCWSEQTNNTVSGEIVSDKCLCSGYAVGLVNHATDSLKNLKFEALICILNRGYCNSSIAANEVRQYKSSGRFFQPWRCPVSHTL